MNDVEKLDGKESSEKSSDKMDDYNQKDDIAETIEEEHKTKEKKIEDVILEEKDENNEETKQKETIEIPENMDSTKEIEKLVRENIKNSIKADNEKKCKNLDELCNNICSIF